MSWFVIVGSVVAIGLLAGFARLLKLGHAAIDNEAEARRLAGELLPEFTVEQAVVCDTGEAALVGGPDGWAYIRRHGAHFVARLLGPAPDVTYELTRVSIACDDRMFGPYVIHLESEPRARELTRMLGTASDAESS
ncbi:hypothetical protein [Stakelama saccharophila]|uniref:Uncharacterized protein n=1 Tax=Stakelama saccharophila TaxID=3075605 RepID=A0ABZ0B8Y0_9SPHN|nr:hypothetical protein [Stakelama sp. W311]WNO53833.1 hypothetical protein RPR59_00815 [Stakelama sp. W311]